MKKRVVFWAVAVVCAFCSTWSYGAAKVLTMSTTTSTQASGLLDLLLPAFRADTGITVKVIAKGTGAALRDGMDGNVDIIFVHAKEREEQFVAAGYGTKRYPVMHNDFVLVGPPPDLAQIGQTADVSEALALIAATNTRFVSRGDDSGTHTKEQRLWRAAGVKTIDVTRTMVKKGTKSTVTFTEPADSSGWYHSIGQGMGKTLIYADEKNGYTLTDRGTYIKYRFGKTPPIDLVIVSEGAAALANPYGVIPVNPKKYPEVKYEYAQALAEWLVSARGQQLIGAYRLTGTRLFFPDAIPQ